MGSSEREDNYPNPIPKQVRFVNDGYCTECQQQFNGSRGLAAHKRVSRMHNKSPTTATINDEMSDEELGMMQTKKRKRKRSKSPNEKKKKKKKSPNKKKKKKKKKS